MNFPSIRTALIAAVIVALGAFVLLRIGDATAQSGCIQPIPDSGTVTGTWNADCLSENTPTEPTNPPSGIRYARFYTFTVSEDADITIDLNSATDTYMFLMAGTGTNGAVLHENDDIERGSNANSRISESLSAGNYTIEATTYEVETAGDFTLTVSGLLDVSTPTATPTIDAGDTPTVTPTPTAPATPTATPTPAPTTVPTDVLNRLAALETLVATQQGLISTLESKITTLDSRVAALEADVPSPTPPPTKTPTATPTTISTPTPTATPVTAATPEPTTPTLTPEAAAHAALSQLLPWYDDPPYPGAVIPIVEVWLRDPEFGRDLAQSPWITDGIDVLENDAVYGLGLLYDRDPALARRLLAYASEEPVQSRNTMFLGGLYAMLLDHRDKFELLIAQSWFTDGVDAGERAFITTLSNTTGIDALYGNLLASPPAARSKTISLPLAGEVTLWAFHNASPPPDEDLLGMMERGVRGTEGFMGAPFPLTDLIVLSLNVDDYDIGYGAVNFVNSLTLLWGTEQTIEEAIVYHEIAHFYLTAEFGPLWLYEGGANFIAEYLTAGSGEVALEDHAPEYCRRHGVENIHSLGDPNHPDPVADVTCAYLIGQYFLTHLYYIMGEAAFSSAMRELYERYLDYRWYPTDEEVYRIFLKHTPPDREAAFLDVYRRLHGGPFIDGS